MARQRFEDVFSLIRSELIDHITAQGMPKEAIQWYTNVRATATLQRPSMCPYHTEPQLQRARRKTKQRHVRRGLASSSQGVDLDRG